MRKAIKSLAKICFERFNGLAFEVEGDKNIFGPPNLDKYLGFVGNASVFKSFYLRGVISTHHYHPSWLRAYSGHSKMNENYFQKKSCQRGIMGVLYLCRGLYYSPSGLMLSLPVFLGKGGPGQKSCNHYNLLVTRLYSFYLHLVHRK